MPRNPKPEPATERAIANLRHGLAARTIAIPGLEEHGDWLNFRDRIIQSLTPDGDLEVELALCIAECLWRRRRIARHEQHLVATERDRDGAKQAWKEHEEKITDMEREELAGEPSHVAKKVQNLSRGYYAGIIANMKIDAMLRPERMLPEKDDLDRLIRYEAHLTRQLYHALHELQALQSRRRGEPAPLARLSVVGLPGA